MAGDGIMCSGHMIVSESTQKVFSLPSGAIIGFAGHCDAIAKARAWFLDGERQGDKPDFKDSDFSALVLRPEGAVQWFGAMLEGVDYELPAATGSGQEIAIGAMEAGLSPSDAVKVVSKRCTTVGGKITELFL